MNRIREIRISRKITQSELANLLGVSQPYVHDLECGNRKLNTGIRKRIAELLDVSENDLQETA